MRVREDRIQRAQALMQRHGLLALMIMNHDDFRYFFEDTWVQPRAILPATGPPVLVAFSGEKDEIASELAGTPVKVFSHVGEQIFNVRQTFLALFGGPPPGLSSRGEGRPKVGMQMWFHTPAFLVDLFRQVNPQLELVPSDPVMDELRMVKSHDEVELMRRAQAIAALGMDRARAMLRPGVTGHEIAAESLYVMMRAGAEGTSTPIHVNSGPRSCRTHGVADERPIEAGDLVVIDLTPQYRGYCANLARTFVLGPPSHPQRALLETYRQVHESTREALKPGATVPELDAIGQAICEAAGFGAYHLNGVSHGIGLRFEETPATTIMPKHRGVVLREDMTMTVGHTVLAVPGVGGVRFEDVCRVTRAGGEILRPYPIDWHV